MRRRPQNPGNDWQRVAATLSVYRRRVMAVAACDGVLEATMAGGVALLCLGRWLAKSLVLALVTGVLAAAAWGAWRAWRAGRNRLELARHLDAFWQNHDRLSNSLALAQLPAAADFARAQLRECASWLAAHSPPWPPLHSRRLEPALLYLLLAAQLLAPAPAGPLPAFLASGGGTTTAVEQQPRQLASQLRQARHRARELGLQRLPALLAAAESEVLTRKSIAPLPPPPAPPPAGESRSSGEAGYSPRSLSTTALPPPGGRAGRASYSPAGKFDSLSAAAYAESFAELDDELALGRLEPEDLRLLSGHIERVAATLNLSARLDDYRAASRLSRPGRAGTAGGDNFDTALAALQQKSFGEFLRRYADHLAALEAGWGTGSSTATPGTTGIAPLPRRGRRTPLQEAASPQALPGTSSSSGPAGTPRQAALSRRQSRHGPAGRVSAAGGAGAGSGAGRGELAPAPVLPRPRRVELVELPRRSPAGVGLFRLLKQLGSGQATASTSSGAGTELGRLLDHYERLAGRAGGSGAVPAGCRDYVRRYFTAIRRLRRGNRP